MGNVFRYQGYLEVLEDFLKSSQHSNPTKALAKELGVHMSKLSKVMAGEQHLTLDQAYVVANFLKFDSKETEYFITLVQVARASNKSFQAFLKKKLKAFHQDGGPLPLNQPDRKFSQSEEAILHSSPYFLAIWHLSMIEEENTFDEIADKLGIEKQLVAQISEFLATLGIIKISGERINAIVRKLNIVSSSGQLEKFLSNWRFMGIQKLNGQETGHFFYSEPMTLGKNAYIELRKRIELAVSDCKKIMASERSEEAVCLNIDLFRIDRSKR